MRPNRPAHPDPTLSQPAPAPQERPKFRTERDEQGRICQTHVGMNRQQRRAARKQQELELRKRLKTVYSRLRELQKLGKLSTTSVEGEEHIPSMVEAIKAGSGD